MKPLILASASPRRQQLLHEAGAAFIVIPSNTAEELQSGESPEEYALRVAREKAQDVAARCPGSWVLGADTIVAVADLVLGKPQDTADGLRMLRLLSGRTHRVITAFALLDGAGQINTHRLVVSQVTFKPLTDDHIHNYLATGEPFDKAGAYAVQGLGAALVERVEGSYTNVVGLPVEEVLAALRTVGILPEND
ncbi:MAG: septum formation inhibitor Maf [Deltaproteobacteria bacterium]|nr:septum formation inhibitor Maf [Deltaproteobacteria bacterium]